MAYQENVELYLTLSYKELQGLCRKHRLPDNKSKTELARLLVEFFTRRALLKENKKNRSAASLKHQEPAVRRERRGKHVSGAKSPAVIPSPKETEGGDRCSQMAGHLESNNQLSSQAFDKVLNNSAEHALICPSNHAMEGLDCSTSESLQAHIKLPPAIGSHESFARLPSGQEYDTSCDDSNLQTLFKIPGQNLLSSNTSLELDGNDLPLFKFINKHSGESSGESGLGLTNENSGEAYPSFQFFVRADEGINLFVDLNSSPSDWVKKLKCEVCIYQNPQKNSWSISNGIKESGNVEEHLKISYPNEMEPSKNISAALQSHELGAKDDCRMSSLKPIVGLDCNSAVSSNGICENSPATTLACDQDRKDQAECLVKGNQTISSFKITCSDMKCGMHVHTDGSVEKHGHISSVYNNCHGSLPDGSSLPNLNCMNNSADAIRVGEQDFSTCLTNMSDHINSRKMILHSPGNLPSRFSDKSNTTMESAVTNISKGTNYTNVLGKRQSVGKESINLPNYPSGRCSHENSASRDALPVMTDELGTVTPLLEDDEFELPDMKSSQLSKNKRLQNSSTLEENLRRKRCADGGYQDSVQRFHSMKSPAKERVSDSSSHPRRSTRLVSKV